MKRSYLYDIKFLGTKKAAIKRLLFINCLFNLNNHLFKEEIFILKEDKPVAQILVWGVIMKRELVLIALLLLILKSLTFGSMEEFTIISKGKYTLADSPKINIVMPRNYLTEGELKEFIGKVERSYYRVMKFLDIEEVEEKIYITLVKGSYISNTGGNTIALSYVRDNRSPYTHELVHAMTNIEIKESEIPNWLYEGMPIYITMKISQLQTMERIFMRWQER